MPLHELKEDNELDDIACSRLAVPCIHGGELNESPGRLTRALHHEKATPRLAASVGTARLIPHSPRTAALARKQFAGGTLSAYAQALSPVGRCKTFDATGDGYGRGEGFAAALLRCDVAPMCPRCCGMQWVVRNEAPAIKCLSMDLRARRGCFHTSIIRASCCGCTLYRPGASCWCKSATMPALAGKRQRRKGEHGTQMRLCGVRQSTRTAAPAA